MCNIVHIKTTKNGIFLLTIYILKLNIQVPMQTYFFKLLNMCKFAHDRKTKIILLYSMNLTFSK